MGKECFYFPIFTRKKKNVNKTTSFIHTFSVCGINHFLSFKMSSKTPE